MRPLSLTLNGQGADLPATTKGLVRFSQARAALSDVAARVGEYSFPLTLPPTRRNQLIFGPDKLHPQGLQKFGPYTDYTYELRVGGQVFSGTFRLTNLRNGYTGSLIGEGLSWALLLGDTKLTDLAFPAVAYDGSQLETILAQNCDQTDVQFPLVAFGNFFAPTTTRILADGTSQQVPAPPAALLDYPLSVDDYPPGVYYANVLRQIFRAIGWQLAGCELDSEFWRSVVLTCAGANLATAWPWGALLPARAQAPAGGVDCFSYFAGGPGDGYSNNAAGFFTLPGDGPALSGEAFFLPLRVARVLSSPTRALDAGQATYTAPQAGVYSFAWSATLASGRQVYDGKALNGGDAYTTALIRPVGLGLVLRRGGQDFTDADGGLLTGQPGDGPLHYAAGQDRVLTPQRLDVPTSGVEVLRLGAYSGTVSVFLEAGDALTLACFARRTVVDGKETLLGYRQEFVLHFSSVSFACTAYVDNNGLSKTRLRPADFLPPLACKDVVKDFLLRTDSFIVADAGRRVATLYSRTELSLAAGEPLDLSALVDPRQVEYLPSAGAGVGSMVFSPAENADEALLPAGFDVVTATIGPGDQSQALASLFAPVAFRAVYFPGGQVPRLPTCASKDTLAQNRSETQPDAGGQPPRLVRYLGPQAGVGVPFQQRTVPLGGAAWDGPLAWDGAGGAVATYYQQVLARAVRGHLARCPVLLTPALYRALTPGRRVYLFGAAYSTEACSNFDHSDEAGICQLDLSREVL